MALVRKPGELVRACRDRITALEAENAALREDKVRLIEALEGVEIIRRDVVNALYRCKDIAHAAIYAARKERDD